MSDSSINKPEQTVGLKKEMYTTCTDNLYEPQPLKKYIDSITLTKLYRSGALMASVLQNVLNFSVNFSHFVSFLKNRKSQCSQEKS